MKKKTSMILIFLFSILVCGVVSAVNEVSVINHFSTGIVDVQLSEYQIQNEKEVEWQDNPVILPGKDISKIPRIKNKGNECYVRVKMDFQNIGEELEDCIYGMDDTWIKKKDGYYYCRKMLETKEEIDFFKGIKIPDDFPQEEEGTVFQMDIAVDAIQSENFTPDFESDSPWGAVEIMECKKGEYDITSFRKVSNQTFSIEYLKNAKTLIANEQDFFINFPALLPGDFYSDNLELKNNSDEEVMLYFRSENMDDSELLKLINLSITYMENGEETLIYEGPMSADEISENLLLSEMAAGTDAKLIFAIRVPEDLDNEYVLLDSAVKWIFSTEPVTNSESREVVKSPKTGDTQKVGALLLVMCGSAGIVILQMRKRRM